MNLEKLKNARGLLKNCIPKKRRIDLYTKAVIFDMDGVITDTMPCHFKVWKIIFRQVGIEVTHEEIYSREGQKGIESIREIFHAHQKVFDSSLAQKILINKEVLFKKIFKRRFIVGSRLLLKTLSRQGFNLALVTGTSRQEVKQLLPPEIFDLFDVTVCGCDVSNGKPHPEPYQKALKALGCQTNDAVVIENAPFGIRSAKAAGLRCLAIATSLPASYLWKADIVFDSIKELNERVVFNYEK